MQIIKSMLININLLYPTESLHSIVPERLNALKEIIKGDGQRTDIFVIEYKNNYYIIKGHHQFLAAAISGAKEVQVNVVKREDLSFFSSTENLESNLRTIGKTALYDFETIGGFSYKKYPEIYNK